MVEKLEINIADSLADEALTRSLAEKFRVVGQKLQNYYDAFKPEIDIPEFLKPLEEQTAYKIRVQLLRIYYGGTLDYWYKRAIEAIEESENFNYGTD